MADRAAVRVAPRLGDLLALAGEDRLPAGAELLGHVPVVVAEAEVRLQLEVRVTVVRGALAEVANHARQPHELRGRLGAARPVAVRAVVATAARIGLRAAAAAAVAETVAALARCTLHRGSDREHQQGPGHAHEARRQPELEIRSISHCSYPPAVSQLGDSTIRRNLDKPGPRGTVAGRGSPCGL